MSSELIVITFPDRGDAKTVLKAVQAMRKSPILNLEGSVLVKKDEKGEITFHPTQESAASQEDSDAQVLLSLAELILGGLPEGAINALTERGMDGRFIKEIAEVMEDESSALFFLARENSVHDAGEMRRTLALFKGRIHQTSLPPEVEAYLFGSIARTEQRKEI